LATDFDGVIHASAAVLAAINADGRIDEDAYAAATAAMTAGGYRVPVLVIWAEALGYADLAGGRTFTSDRDSVAGCRDRKALRHARQMMAAARAARDAGSKHRLVRQAQRSCRWLGQRADDLVRILAVATRPVEDILGAPGGLDQLFKVVAIVLNTAREPAPARAIAPSTAMLAAIAAGHPDHAARQLDAARPRELLTVLIPVAQLVLASGAHVALELGPDNLPIAMIDPAEVNDHAFMLTYRLVDALASHDPRQIEPAMSAVAAANEHDIGLIAWYFAMTIGSRLGQLFATYAARARS
jgi:hypothetical protein